METERPWQSRTMWKAFITVIIGGAALFGFDFGLTAEQEVTLLGGIMTIVGVVATYLRTVSTKTITMKPPKDRETPLGV